MMNENMFESKDMIFNNQSGGGIQSGGLSIKSIMMSKGISPIMSINTDKDSKNVERVSELFENLVIPLGLINGIKNMNSGYNIMDDERYIYDDERDGTYGKFVIDVIREPKGQMKSWEIPCKYNYETKWFNIK